MNYWRISLFEINSLLIHTKQMETNNQTALVPLCSQLLQEIPPYNHTNLYTAIYIT